MTEPVVAAKAPDKVTLEAGKDYWWCACGLSKSQPFCDIGLTKGSEANSVALKFGNLCGHFRITSCLTQHVYPEGSGPLCGRN